MGAKESRVQFDGRPLEADASRHIDERLAYDWTIGQNVANLERDVHKGHYFGAAARGQDSRVLCCCSVGWGWVGPFVLVAAAARPSYI